MVSSVGSITISSKQYNLDFALCLNNTSGLGSKFISIEKLPLVKSVVPPSLVRTQQLLFYYFQPFNFKNLLCHQSL